MSGDLLCSLALILVLVGFTGFYFFQSRLKDRVTHSRVQKQGGSRLLPLSVLEIGYRLIDPVGQVLVSWGVEAHWISFASLGLGLFAGMSIALGQFGWAALLSFGSALGDTLDGCVARLSNTSADSGEVLDAAVDRYVEFAILAGLAMYYRENFWALSLVLLALSGSFLVSYTTAKAESFSVKLPAGGMRRPERMVYLTLGALLSPWSCYWLEAPAQSSFYLAYPMLLALLLIAGISHFFVLERWVFLYEELKMRELREQVKKERSCQVQGAGIQGVDQEASAARSFQDPFEEMGLRFYPASEEKPERSDELMSLSWVTVASSQCASPSPVCEGALSRPNSEAPS